MYWSGWPIPDTMATVCAGFSSPRCPPPLTARWCWTCWTAGSSGSVPVRRWRSLSALDNQYVNLMRNQINHALGDSSNRGKMHALNRLGYHANLGRLTTQELASFFLESVGRLEHLGREVKAASGAPLPQPPESPSPQVTEDLLRQLQEKANAKML